MENVIAMPNRRDMLRRSAAVAALMAGVGALPEVAQAAYAQAAFDAKSLNDVVKALGISAPTASAAVSLTAPDIAENGAVVPVGCSTTLPGVKRLLIAVDKNPSTLCAAFDVTDAIEANLNTRIKMAQSSNVYAIAVMTDGKVLFAQKEVKVTLGGCGG